MRSAVRFRNGRWVGRQQRQGGMRALPGERSSRTAHGALTADGRRQLMCALTCPAMAAARPAGTAFPIWRAISILVPHQAKSSGKS